MKNSRLIQTLKSLAPPEQEQFRLYVSAPYFNTHLRLITFLERLLSFSGDWEHPDLNKELLFQYLFPGKAFSAQRMRDDISLLYRLLKDFISHQKLKKDDFQKGIYLLDYLREKGIEQAFQVESARLHRKKGITRSWEQCRRKYKLADLANEFYGQRLIRTADFSLQDKLDELDRFYLTLKLKESCEALSRRHILNIEYRMHLLEEVELMLNNKSHVHLDTPAIRVYHSIYLCLKTPDREGLYENMVKALDQHRDSFEPKEARAMYKYAQNYCIRRINQGESYYQHRLFELYQQLLESALILDHGQIAHTDYKNITTLALRLQAFDWAKEFIYGYREKIGKDHRENAFQYCQATYLAETGNLKEAIRGLRDVTFTDALYDLSARHLLARIYLEAEDLEALRYHLNAFNLYLRRTKSLSTSNKPQHLQFVRLLKAILELKERLFYLNETEIKKRKARILKRLEDPSPIAYRDWLREQL